MNNSFSVCGAFWLAYLAAIVASVLAWLQWG